MGIRWIGLDKAQKTFHDMPKDVKKALVTALYQEAEQIMTKSKRMTPVDVGVLRNSGFVDQPKVDGTKVTVEMGYGGAASAYALAQHERMDYAHTVGGPKFLERPVNESVKDMRKRLGKAVEKAAR